MSEVGHIGYVISVSFRAVSVSWITLLYSVRGKKPCRLVRYNRQAMSPGGGF